MRSLSILLTTLLLAGCGGARRQAVGSAERALAVPGLAELARAYGLPGESLEQSSLGRRYRMLLVARGRHDSWDRAVIPLQVWRAPLLLEGKPLALVTLARHQGKMQAVELGAAALARELVAMEAPSPAAELAILRADQAGADFLVVTSRGTRLALPLASARRALGLGGATLSEGELLDQLRRAGR